MSHLPDVILIMIFEHLDNESLLNAVLSSPSFVNIFSSSSRLLLKFNLHISQQNFTQYSSNEALKSIPFKNVTLSDYTIFNSCQLHDFVYHFKDSIQILKLQNVTFDRFQHLSSFFMDFSNLKTLYLEKCFINGQEVDFLDPIPTLKSITFDECRRDLFKFFKNQNSIEKVRICRHEWISDGFSSRMFNDLAETLPNLKHLILDGTGTSGYFDCGHFPFKLQKLEAFLMTFNWTQTVPRLDFLRSQQGHLKELSIHKLPYDYDGGEILKFIIEKMGLEKFYFREIPLILNGRKQEVREFKPWEVNITATFEMFRQFPLIQSLSLFLTATHLYQPDINDIVNPRTDLFQNLKNLYILDHSGPYGDPSKFIGLYKNCRNITRLSLRTDNGNVNNILSECLSYFTSLNEIYLTTRKDKLKDSLKIIKRLAPNLKILSVSKEVVQDAKEIFSDEVKILKII